MIEEVYIELSVGFECLHFPGHVYKHKKTLYGLKQALMVWCDCLTTFLVNHSYKRGAIDKMSFIEHINDDIICARIYVDDIVFGSM